MKAKRYTISWKSPPNLAIVKYWGKTDGQIPMNASVSFVLDGLHTTTRVNFTPATSAGELAGIWLNGVFDQKLALRTDAYIRSLYPVFPSLAGFRLEVHTANNFPHGAGIASSASGFSAMALCIAEFAAQLNEEILPGFTFLQKASYLARMGSGSAARSVYPGFSVWGETPVWEGANNAFAIEIAGETPHIWRQLNDTILVVHDAPKTVSSSEGHRRMQHHPFVDGRKIQAENNLKRFKSILAEEDLPAFVLLAEEESLTLHALMLSASPGYWLFQPLTLQLLAAIRHFRESTGVPAGFSIDAGANVHFLWFERDREVVLRFLNDALAHICPPSNWLWSSVGSGPVKIE